MNIYQLFHIVLLCCMMSQGRSKTSASHEANRESNDGSASKERGSGWWGGGSRNRPSKPSTSNGRGSGLWGGGSRNRPSKPSTSNRRGSGLWGLGSRNRPSKPSTSNRRGSGLWGGSSRNRPSKPSNMKMVIAGYEGIKLKAYDAQPKNKKVHDTTIGIGFNMNRPDARKTFEKIVPGKKFDKVKAGKESITKEQARALFDHDVDKIYEPNARNRVGKKVYDKLPSNVKTAVVNAVYRGDLGPKTTNLIKEGKWNEVGKEYLDHNQYRDAEKLGISGIKKRMDWNKAQFDTMKKSDTATP